MTCIDDLQSTAKPFPTVHTILSLNSRLCWTIESFQTEKAPKCAKKGLCTPIEALVPPTAICQDRHSPNQPK
jgi:hypothetical protein